MQKIKLSKYLLTTINKLKLQIFVVACDDKATTYILGGFLFCKTFKNQKELIKECRKICLQSNS